MRRKSFFTGAGIIVVLVGLVLTARHFRGPASEVRLNNNKTKGSRDALVHLVVYSDFQCPACRTALRPLEDLQSEFKKQVKLEFRHFPLERNHRWAVTAAGFAECAAQEGRFWEFHDRLFQEQATWAASEDALKFFAEIASELKLDPQKLQRCLENPETLSRIRRERGAGETQGVQSTPTMFINGKMLVGANQLLAQGKGIIEEALRSKEK